MKSYDLRRLSPAEIRQLAMAQKIVLILPLGRELLRQRLEELRAETKKLHADLGYTIQDYPDTPENATYNLIKVKLENQIPRQIHDVREQMATTQDYVDPAEEGIVGLGRQVELELPGGTQTFHLTGPIEASLGGHLTPFPLSYLSPVGAAVWGRRQGETVILPNGKSVVIRKVFS
jgi:transcription elongation GreA/GreB family factor